MIPISNIIKWMGVALLALVIFWKGVVPGFNQVNSDFPNYYVGSKLFVKGHEVAKFYDNEWFLEKAQEMEVPFAKFTPFPPTTVFVMLPLSGFSVGVAKQIWTILNVFLGLGIVFLIKRISKGSWLDSTLMLMLTGFSLINNFFLGQFYLLLTFLLFGFYYLERNWHYRSSGVLLALGIMFKYLPVVYLPILLLRKSKVLFWMGISLIALGVIMVSTIGWEAFRVFFNQVFFNHLNGHIEGQKVSSYAFQSINALLSNLFKSSVASFGVLGFNMLVVSITGYTCWRLYKNQANQMYGYGVIGVSVMLMLPATASYHMLLLLFPVVLLWDRFSNDIEGWKPWILLFLFAAIGWFNIGNTKILWDSTHPLAILASFPRFWLLVVLWGYVMFVVNTIKFDDNKAEIAQ